MMGRSTWYRYSGGRVGLALPLLPHHTDLPLSLSWLLAVISESPPAPPRTDQQSPYLLRLSDRKLSQNLMLKQGYKTPGWISLKFGSLDTFWRGPFACQCCQLYGQFKMTHYSKWELQV